MQITHDWTQGDDIGDKLANKVEAGVRASLDIDGAANADIYVLLSGNQTAGKGMLVELGAALALQQTRGIPQIYLVGPLNHLSIFYLHPAVKHVETVEDVIKDLSRTHSELLV